MTKMRSVCQIQQVCEWVISRAKCRRDLTYSSMFLETSIKPLSTTKTSVIILAVKLCLRRKRTEKFSQPVIFMHLTKYLPGTNVSGVGTYYTKGKGSHRDLFGAE